MIRDRIAAANIDSGDGGRLNGRFHLIEYITIDICLPTLGVFAAIP